MGCLYTYKQCQHKLLEQRMSLWANTILNTSSIAFASHTHTQFPVWQLQLWAQRFNCVSLIWWHTNHRGEKFSLRQDRKRQKCGEERCWFTGSHFKHLSIVFLLMSAEPRSPTRKYSGELEGFPHAPLFFLFVPSITGTVFTSSS